MAKMVDISTMWKCETCFHHKNGECSPEIWCENGEGYRPAYNKLVFIEAEPLKHGKWIEGAENFSNGNYNAECKDCGAMIKWSGCSEDFNYCPNCGARMDGE